MTSDRGDPKTEPSSGPEPLRDELERLRAIFDLSGDAIFILGEDGTFVEANAEACSRYGYPRDEILKLHIGALDVPEERHLVPERIGRMVKEGRGSFVATHLARDGRRIPEEVNSRTVVVGGHRFFISVCRDVTERLKAEEDRRELEAQVQHAQKLESLGVLAGGIAHDFNNLLMAILGHVEVALTDLSPLSPVREDLVAVEKAAHRAADLSRQMLAYAGKGRFVIQPIDLGELVAEMGQMVDISLSKKASVRYALAHGLPPIRGDATQLRQVVLNLVINASEAIGDSPGTINVVTGTVRCDRAWLRRQGVRDDLPEGDYVFLEVADDGCGMDEATVARIFDPFFTTKFVGRGLGLAAVQGIVRSHGGAVIVQSEIGRGTTFSVLLPVAPAAPAAEPKPIAAQDGWRGHGLVLLADDEELVRVVAVRMLERLGFQVLTASDGQEAVALFESRRRELRCVILDLTMPRLDGEEAFHAIRRIDPAARVLLSSGYGPPEVTRRFEGKGLAGFVQKPYQFETLRSTLKGILG